MAFDGNVGIRHSFIRGYFGVGDFAMFTTVGEENTSLIKLEELRAFGRSL